MPKFFTIAEAESLLSEIGQAMQDARKHRIDYQAADQEMNRAKARIQAAGGLRVDPAPFLAIRERLDSSEARVKEAIERVHELGAHVKDLDQGLVDFLTLYRGKQVYLCWKVGEPRIEHWHGLEEGFRGRKPIDADFRSNHRGED